MSSIFYKIIDRNGKTWDVWLVEDYHDKAEALAELQFYKERSRTIHKTPEFIEYNELVDSLQIIE